MSRISRSVVVMATASVAAGVLVAPGAAHAADTTTKLSAAGMVAELKAASITSTAAAERGWKATMSLTSSDVSGTGQYIVDPAAGIATDQIRARATGAAAYDAAANYAVADKGMYEYTDDPTTQAAVKMMRRPSVRYVFTSKAVKLDPYIRENLPVPAVILTEDVNYAGTRSVRDDGSKNYTHKDRDGMTAVFHIDPAGVLTSARFTAPDLTMAVGYTYGPQRVTLPAPAVTVDAKTLAAAVAYLTMPASVKGVADRGAAATRRAAKGKTVNVASLRTIVRREAVAHNASSKVNMIKASTIGGGIRVSATNPWTRTTVSYTVKASGSKVLVANG